MPTTEMMVEELIKLRQDPNGVPLDQFWKLLERFRADLVNQAYANLSSQEDAEDVAQETLSYAFLNLKQLRDPLKIGAWLRKINKNKAIDLLRRKARSMEERLSTGQMGAIEAPGKTTGPVSGVEMIMQIVDSLTEEYREVLVLRYWEKLSNEQIAERLEIPVGTVWSRMSRADALLAEKLKLYLNQERHPK
jgi:RNA polymerase sigma-70 factor, ECF subfamily